MTPDSKKAATGHSNAIDRLSDMPDSILHNIISFMDSKASCRTSILSKRWTHVWSTGFILDFNPHFYDCDSIALLLNFIETTMQRYVEHNLSIRKFNLEYPIVHQGMARNINRWLEIAVQNQVEALSFSITQLGTPTFELPAVLFSAKSLMSMECCRVRVPYYQTLKLIALQSLKFSEVHIDECMLRDILLSCPLKRLSLMKCSGLESISVPQSSSLEMLELNQSIPKGGRIVVDTSRLQHFIYHGNHENASWPFILKSATKKNLRALSVFSIDIVDNIVDKLVSELSSIKFMGFYNCGMPKSIRIASPTLHELNINDCYGLVDIDIDAPKVERFFYNGGLQLSSVISTHSECNAYLHLTLDDLDNLAFRRIKNLLSKSNCCKVLSIILGDAPEIEFDKDQLSKFHDVTPYDIEELKLCLCSVLSESSLIDMIDGLLWSCRPNMLSLSSEFDNQNTISKSLVEIMQKKVKCSKHPLERIEIEGGNCSNLFGSSDRNLRLRLYW